jgi:hypothetical protein
VDRVSLGVGDGEVRHPALSLADLAARMTLQSRASIVDVAQARRARRRVGLDGRDRMKTSGTDPAHF